MSKLILIISFILCGQIYSQDKKDSKFRIIIPGIAINQLSFQNEATYSDVGLDLMLDNSNLFFTWTPSVEYRVNNLIGISYTSFLGYSGSKRKYENQLESRLENYDIEMEGIFSGTSKIMPTLSFGYTAQSLSLDVYQSHHKFKLIHKFGFGCAKIKYRPFDFILKEKGTNYFYKYEITPHNKASLNLSYFTHLILDKYEWIGLFLGVNYSKFETNFKIKYTDVFKQEFSTDYIHSERAVVFVVGLEVKINPKTF